jgi:hypothetical protein
MMNHIFTEPTKGSIAHTRASRLLAEDNFMQSWVGFFLDDTWKASEMTVEAMKKWPGSESPLETGIQLAFETDKHWFEVLGSNPEMYKRFGISMQSLSQGAGYEVEYLSDHYPWAKLPTGSVVDVSRELVALGTCWQSKTLTRIGWQRHRLRQHDSRQGPSESQDREPRP